MGFTAKAALLLSTGFLVLRPASFFLMPTRPGRAAAADSTHPGRVVQERHLSPVLARSRGALVMMAGVDGDIPGLVDSRLAGWRVGKAPSDSAAAADSSLASERDGGYDGDEESGEPRCGDVVEYPLSDLVKSESNDSREKGVAVIVSINKLRNDAWKLPEDVLDKAELQVLCPDLDGEEEGIWMADELESCAFANLGELKVLESTFNGAMDKWKRWTISDELSEGCGARDAEWEYDML